MTTRAQLLAAVDDDEFLRLAAGFRGGLPAAQAFMRSNDVIRGGGTCRLVERPAGESARLAAELRVRETCLADLDAHATQRATRERERLRAELHVRQRELARIAAEDKRRSAATPARSEPKAPLYQRAAPLMKGKDSPAWTLPGPARTLDPSDPDVQSTARHEAAHCAAAALLNWEVTGVQLKAEGGGDCGIRRPKYLDRRLGYQQFAVICLAARAYVGWTAFPGDRKDKWDAHEALSNLGDPNRVSLLKDAARAEAEQMAASPKFRKIARRIEEALLLKGALTMREVEPLLRHADREHARAAW